MLASLTKIIAGSLCGVCGLLVLVAVAVVLIVLFNPPGGNPRE